jgi:polysaccharide biosynthesis/export protein
LRRRPETGRLPAAIRTHMSEYTHFCRLLVLAALLTSSVVLQAQGGAPGTDYRVGPKDVLVVSVFRHADLSGKFLVSADGAITLPLVGAVPVAGQTVSEIEAGLTARFAQGYLRQPQISVEVATYQSQRVFVIGEVRLSGPLTLNGSMTLLEVLSQASMTEEAGGEILILRPESPTSPGGPVVPGQQGVTEVGRLSVQQLRSGSVAANLPLRNGDTVFVPRAEAVFVLGQVNRPGQYTMQDHPTTVSMAIALAGGPTQLGSTRRVRIIRIVDGKRVEERAGLDDVLQHGDTVTVGARLF